MEIGLQGWRRTFVLPQDQGNLTKLVIPTLLWMGWAESPPYLCTASETARDVATWYINSPEGDLPTHKFLDFSMGDPDVNHLPETDDNTAFRYFVNVYVENFIPMVIATLQRQYMTRRKCSNAWDT